MAAYQPAVPDPPEISAALWHGFGGKIAYDIGANAGQTIPEELDRFDQVYAFEPALENRDHLVKHFGANERVHLVMVAVSDMSDTLSLHEAPSKIDTGQLVTLGTDGMEWSDDVSQNGRPREVPAVALDDFISENPVPEFLKIDVEGHEAHVIRGALGLLEARRPQMLIEVHSQALGEWIQRTIGPWYEVEPVRHPHYRPGSPLYLGHYWLRCFQK